MKKYFIIPSILGVLMFYIIPFFIEFGFSLNFLEKNIFINYLEVVHNKVFQLALLNTVKFSIIAIPLLLLLSLLLALTTSYFFSNDYVLTIVMFPVVLPNIALTVSWKLIFSKSGLLNSSFSIITNWFADKYAFYLLIFTFIWKNIGLFTLIWLISINGVSKTQIEVAKLEGANFYQLMKYVVFPHLFKIAPLVLVLSLFYSLKVFREAYLVGGDYPASSIFLIQHAFNNWFSDLQVAYLASGSTILTVGIIMLIILLATVMVRKR